MTVLMGSSVRDDGLMGVLLDAEAAQIERVGTCLGPQSQRGVFIFFLFDYKI